MSWKMLEASLGCIKMKSKSEPFKLAYVFVTQREILQDGGVLISRQADGLNTLVRSLDVLVLFQLQVLGLQELQKAWKAVKGGGGGSLHSAAALCSLVRWWVIG